jgi:hypothetical protein
MKMLSTAVIGAAMLVLSMPALAHYDVAPYFQDGKLLTGGRDHSGNSFDPTITAYLYDFGEEESDPFNLSDPGVNQAAGIGNLPASATIQYNILSSLVYWDGSGDTQFITPPTGTYLELMMGTNTRTLDAVSGHQTGSLVQTVTSTGVVHKHFVTSLVADTGTSNVPGETDFEAPEIGIYAFELELTMTTGGTTYTSNPFWVVFNNGLSEDQHGAAGVALSGVPEPASLSVVALGAAGLLLRRKRPQAAGHKANL